MRIGAAERQETQIVADEIDRVVIRDERGKTVEDRALVRLFDMGLERQVALGFRQLEHGVHHPEDLEIAVLVVLRALEDLAERLGDTGEDRLRVGDHERADGGAEDDDVLERLPKHAEVAAGAHVAADDAPCHDHETDYEEHRASHEPLDGLIRGPLGTDPVAASHSRPFASGQRWREHSRTP